MVDPTDVDIRFTLYGDDGELGEREPLGGRPAHKLGMLITVTAATQAIAHAVGANAAHVRSNLPITEHDGITARGEFARGEHGLKTQLKEAFGVHDP